MNSPPAAQSAVEMEGEVWGSSLDWVILLGGVLYGPGTGREEQWRELARRGEPRWAGEGDRGLSLVHVVDFARAFVEAVDHGRPGSVLNAVDDRPVTERQLYG